MTPALTLWLAPACALLLQNGFYRAMGDKELPSVLECALWPFTFIALVGYWFGEAARRRQCKKLRH